jgi:hypothetical protein
LPPESKGKVQNAVERGDTRKKRKNEGTGSAGELLGFRESNKKTNEEEETPKLSGKFNK